ncbi:protein of unknown function [Sphingomonas palmae]|uniref:DUF4893 domain-containing protein n=1 Tax=Sphingomonas palmae TaxID=1855283 RepID=A0A1H7HQ99_9SPHN|nr:DUF4893 domain-containing protein [Sphingomonas palmae]SEK52461.1 protein of unknown function [Sphingomonas palmae]
MTIARLACAGLALVALGGCGGKDVGTSVRSVSEQAAAEPATGVQDWRAIATVADRQRLREWRTAWIAALQKARAGGAGAKIDADPALYAYDAALSDPVPPAGDYRCRTVKLGAKTAAGLDYVAYPFFRCRIASDENGVSLAKLTGSQRISGTIYPSDTSRAVFLGTIALGDERSAMRYGRDTTRDVAGWVERIGPQRWRLVQPYPAFESTLDVLELVPA